MTAALEGVNADDSVRCLLILASLMTDELLARIDQEAKIFSERLNSPEAKAAFEAFFARKR